MKDFRSIPEAAILKAVVSADRVERARALIAEHKRSRLEAFREVNGGDLDEKAMTRVEPPLTPADFLRLSYLAKLAQIDGPEGGVMAVIKAEYPDLFATVGSA